MIGADLFDRALQQTHVGGHVFGDERAHVVRQIEAERDGFVLDDRHARLKIRRLDVRNQAPFEPGFQTVLQTQHLIGRPVGGQDDLVVVLVEVIEGMEKFLLRRFLAGDKLNIVNQKQIGVAVFIAELIVPALLQGGNQLVCKLIALDIDDIIAGVVLMHDAGDGVKQVRFAKAGRAVNKKGIIRFRRVIGDGNGGGVREAVRGADDKVVEGELRVKLDELRLLRFAAIGLDFRIVEHDDVDVQLEDLLHGFLDIADAAAENDILAEGGGGVEHELFIRQLENLSVVKPGRHDLRGQAGLHMPQNLGPDVSGRIHGAAPFCMCRAGRKSTKLYTLIIAQLWTIFKGRWGRLFNIIRI